MNLEFDILMAVFWGAFFPGLEGFQEIYNPNVNIFRPDMLDIAAFMEPVTNRGRAWSVLARFNTLEAPTSTNGSMLRA